MTRHHLDSRSKLHHVTISYYSCSVPGDDRTPDVFHSWPRDVPLHSTYLGKRVHLSFQFTSQLSSNPPHALSSEVSMLTDLLLRLSISTYARVPRSFITKGIKADQRASVIGAGSERRVIRRRTRTALIPYTVAGYGKGIPRDVALDALDTVETILGDLEEQQKGHEIRVGTIEIGTGGWGVLGVITLTVG